MLAYKTNNSERVFVPIVPLRVNNQTDFEREKVLVDMKAKNPDLLRLMQVFDLK